MSTPTSSTLNGDGKGQPRIPIGREANINHENPSAVVTGFRMTAPATDSINSGFTVGSQLPTPSAKPVDRRTLAGSTPGDFRVSGDWAKNAMDQIANPPDPRQQMGQFPLSGRQVAAPAPITTADDAEIGS